MLHYSPAIDDECLFDANVIHSIWKWYFHDRNNDSKRELWKWYTYTFNKQLAPCSFHFHDEFMNRFFSTYHHYCHTWTSDKHKQNHETFKWKFKYKFQLCSWRNHIRPLKILSASFLNYSLENVYSDNWTLFKLIRINLNRIEYKYIGSLLHFVFGSFNR